VISIFKELFTNLEDENCAPIEKSVISYANNFIESGDGLIIKVISCQGQQELQGFYFPEPNVIQLFFQQDIKILKETLIHELVHYLTQKAFNQSIPETNGFMNIIGSIESYVCGYIKDDIHKNLMQETFFTKLRDISQKNSLTPQGVLKAKFFKDDYDLETLSIFDEFSNCCPNSYKTFGSLLAEIMPRSVTLISKFQTNSRVDKMPKFLTEVKDFFDGVFNEAIQNELNALEEIIGSFCSKMVGEILENIYEY
jgi:hypothetical protein